MRGIGETNTEIMKRHLKYKILKIETELKEYEQMRKLHADDCEVHFIRLNGVNHPSDFPAMAMEAFHLEA